MTSRASRSGRAERAASVGTSGLDFHRKLDPRRRWPFAPDWSYSELDHPSGRVNEWCRQAGARTDVCVVDVRVDIGVTVHLEGLQEGEHRAHVAGALGGALGVA
jgi:hypothetical protein